MRAVRQTMQGVTHMMQGYASNAMVDATSARDDAIDAKVMQMISQNRECNRQLRQSIVRPHIFGVQMAQWNRSSPRRQNDNLHPTTMKRKHKETRKHKLSQHKLPQCASCRSIFYHLKDCNLHKNVLQIRSCCFRCMDM